MRQLRNAVDRAQILANGQVITLADLPLEVQAGFAPRVVHEQPAAGAAGFERAHERSADERMAARVPAAAAEVGGLPSRLEDLEKAHIVEILRQQNGNKRAGGPGAGDSPPEAVSTAGAAWVARGSSCVLNSSGLVETGWHSAPWKA